MVNCLEFIKLSKRIHLVLAAKISGWRARCHISYGITRKNHETVFLPKTRIRNLYPTKWHNCYFHSYFGRIGQYFLSFSIGLRIWFFCVEKKNKPQEANVESPWLREWLHDGMIYDDMLYLTSCSIDLMENVYFHWASRKRDRLTNWSSFSDARMHLKVLVAFYLWKKKDFRRKNILLAPYCQYHWNQILSFSQDKNIEKHPWSSEGDVSKYHNSDIYVTGAWSR